LIIGDVPQSDTLFDSKHFFRDWGKHIILLFNVAAIFVHPKPMVEGGGVFGEDGRKSALLQMTSLIMGHNRKKDASISIKVLDFSIKSQG